MLFALLCTFTLSAAFANAQVDSSKSDEGCYPKAAQYWYQSSACLGNWACAHHQAQYSCISFEERRLRVCKQESLSQIGKIDPEFMMACLNSESDLQKLKFKAGASGENPELSRNGKQPSL